MDALHVAGLTKRLGGNLVVDNASFGVAEGEFFVLLGPSGGGKSTILRLICGLERPDAGQIVIGGRDVTNAPPRERNIGMVFQGYGLYPNMNVFQNIAYGLEARGGLSRAEISARVNAAADRLGLTPMLRRSIVDLSGGEQQRVALARALARDAAVYLFDEPLSNLDPKLRHQARRDILALHRDKRKPSVYVTHDQTEAFAMADRIAVFARGRLQQIGTTEDLLRAPANMFVAGFLGSPPMNLLPGSVTREDGAPVFHADGVALALPPQAAPLLERHSGERVALGVRPDSITLAGAESAAPDAIAARVEDVEALIGETVVKLRAGRDTLVWAVLGDDSADALAAGDHVRLRIDTRALRFFDAESERAIEG